MKKIYAFGDSNTYGFDPRMVRYFIEHKDYNVIKIDMVLFDYGLDPLSKESK